jgi:hypothetical protein
VEMRRSIYGVLRRHPKSNSLEARLKRSTMVLVGTFGSL